MPKDKVTGLHQSYGFVEFRGEDDVEYAVKVLNMVKLHGKSLRVNKASSDRTKQGDVGANLFIGNLAPDVDEKSLYDTFSAFGGISGSTRVQRDPETGVSKGFGFVSFDSFEASDLAIECMHGQFLADRQLVVQYALRKDSKGERHGSAAERMLAAAQRKGSTNFRPHTHFAERAGGQVTSIMPASGPGAAPMLGTAVAAPPPMLPPTAILPSSFASGGPGGMGMPMPMRGGPMMQPPPLPGVPHVGRMGTTPAWMTAAAAAAGSSVAAAGAPLVPPPLPGTVGAPPRPGGVLVPPPLPGMAVAPPQLLPSPAGAAGQPMMPPPLPPR